MVVVVQEEVISIREVTQAVYVTPKNALQMQVLEFVTTLTSPD